jgi:homoserine kinase
VCLLILFELDITLVNFKFIIDLDFKYVNETNLKSTSAFAPATVANVVCGFDVFGFAVDQPGDVVKVQWRSEPGVIITSVVGDDGRLPLEPEKNTAGVAVIQFLEKAGITKGIEIALHKNLPLGSGMGSSAASAVAALVAVNQLAGTPYSKKELLPFAMEAERVACGSAHADNIAPSLLGGFVLIRSYHPLDIISIPFPEYLCCVLVHPNIELKTKDARQLLKPTLLLRDAVQQWGNTAGLVAGLMKSDDELIARSMTDLVAEPARSLLIPGYDAVKVAAKEMGAIGCGISGSGPTMFALCNKKAIAEDCGKSMIEAFKKAGLSSEMYVCKLNNEGAKVL